MIAAHHSDETIAAQASRAHARLRLRPYLPRSDRSFQPDDAHLDVLVRTRVACHAT
jgi:hypothetical protein